VDSSAACCGCGGEDWSSGAGFLKRAVKEDRKNFGAGAGGRAGRGMRWAFSRRMGRMRRLVVPIRVTGDAASPLAEAAADWIVGPTWWPVLLSP
jgi:hypothetical protein